MHWDQFVSFVSYINLSLVYTICSSSVIITFNLIQLHHRCLIPWNVRVVILSQKFLNFKLNTWIKFAKLLFDISLETIWVKVSSGKILNSFKNPTSSLYSSLINNSIRSITFTTSLHAIDISHHWCVVHVYELCFNYAILLRNSSFFHLMFHQLYQNIKCYADWC